jgi:hypothetical protein
MGADAGEASGNRDVFVSTRNAGFDLFASAAIFEGEFCGVKGSRDSGNGRVNNGDRGVDI